MDMRCFNSGSPRDLLRQQKYAKSVKNLEKRVIYGFAVVRIHTRTQYPVDKILRVDT